jgi:hypothetical protein
MIESAANVRATSHLPAFENERAHLPGLPALIFQSRMNVPLRAIKDERKHRPALRADAKIFARKRLEVS